MRLYCCLGFVKIIITPLIPPPLSLQHFLYLTLYYLSSILSIYCVHPSLLSLPLSFHMRRSLSPYLCIACCLNHSHLHCCRKRDIRARDSPSPVTAVLKAHFTGCKTLTQDSPHSLTHTHDNQKDLFTHGVSYTHTHRESALE